MAAPWRLEFQLLMRMIWLGVADLDFLFHMFFLARYCKLLEETSFRGRTADFLFMLLFGGTILTTIVVGGGLLKFAAPFADILFLSNSLTFMMVRHGRGGSFSCILFVEGSRRGHGVGLIFVGVLDQKLVDSRQYGGLDRCMCGASAILMYR